MKKEQELLGALFTNIGYYYYPNSTNKKSRGGSTLLEAVRWKISFCIYMHDKMQTYIKIK